MAELKQQCGVLNISIYKDNTRNVELDWNIDLTLYTFSAKVVNASTGALIVEIPVVVVDLALGKITLEIDDAVALATPVGTYKWDLNWVDPDGFKRTVLAGAYVVATP